MQRSDLTTYRLQSPVRKFSLSPPHGRTRIDHSCSSVNQQLVVRLVRPWRSPGQPKLQYKSKTHGEKREQETPQEGEEKGRGLGQVKGVGLIRQVREGEGGGELA